MAQGGCIKFFERLECVQLDSAHLLFAFFLVSCFTVAFRVGSTQGIKYLCSSHCKSFHVRALEVVVGEARE